MGNCRLFRLFAENWSHGILGVLQHYRHETDLRRCPLYGRNKGKADVAQTAQFGRE